MNVPSEVDLHDFFVAQTGTKFPYVSVAQGSLFSRHGRRVLSGYDRVLLLFPPSDENKFLVPGVVFLALLGSRLKRIADSLSLITGSV